MSLYFCKLFLKISISAHLLERSNNMRKIGVRSQSLKTASTVRLQSKKQNTFLYYTLSGL